MKKNLLILAIIYSVVVIAFKLYIVLGGHALSRFGFYYSNAVSVFMAVPFFVAAILMQRRKNGGYISGREALRSALLVFGISTIIISIYNYVEFEQFGKKLAIEYYNGSEFLDFLKKQPKIKPEDYPKIIEEQVKNAETSAFKATTGKLISIMLLGLSSAFICAVLLKKNPKSQSKT